MINVKSNVPNCLSVMNEINVAQFAFCLEPWFVALFLEMKRNDVYRLNCLSGKISHGRTAVLLDFVEMRGG